MTVVRVSFYPGPTTHDTRCLEQKHKTSLTIPLFPLVVFVELQPLFKPSLYLTTHRSGLLPTSHRRILEILILSHRCQQ